MHSATSPPWIFQQTVIEPINCDTSEIVATESERLLHWSHTTQRGRQRMLGNYKTFRSMHVSGISPCHAQILQHSPSRHTEQFIWVEFCAFDRTMLLVTGVASERHLFHQQGRFVQDIA